MRSSRTPCLNDLSDAELATVFRAVPFAERARLACVCRRWRVVCAGGDVWRSVELNLARGLMMRREEKDTAAMLAWFVARRGGICDLTVIVQTNQDWADALLVLGMLCGDLQKLSVLAAPEGMNYVPNMAFLGVMPRLQSLWVDYRHPSSIQTSCMFPPGLTELTLRDCSGLGQQVEELPGWLSRLSALRRLRFESLFVVEDPLLWQQSGALGSIRGLTTLERLDLRNIYMSHLPSWLSGLSRLTAVCLARCSVDCPGSAQLAPYFDALAGLPALATLDLRCSLLWELPAPVQEVTSLTALLLSGSSVRTLPEGPYLRRLERLDLGALSLSGVPPTLLTCTALRRLNMAVLGAPDKGPAISLRDLRALLRRNPGMRELQLLEGALGSGDVDRLAGSFPQVRLVLVSAAHAAGDDPDFGPISDGHDDSDFDVDSEEEEEEEEGGSNDVSWDEGSLSEEGGSSEGDLSASDDSSGPDW